MFGYQPSFSALLFTEDKDGEDFIPCKLQVLFNTEHKISWIEKTNIIQ